MKQHVFAGSLALLLAACSSTQTKITPVDRVDLQKFMGDWYVIAHIPGPMDRDAHNAIETYRLDADGKIQTVYRQRLGGFDKPEKIMHPVGTVVPGTNNAVWGMRFVWPIKAEYVIVGLDPDYRYTTVGRSKRDYAWIMARTPQIDDALYIRLVDDLRVLGYDVNRLRKIPQQWPTARNP